MFTHLIIYALTLSINLVSCVEEINSIHKFYTSNLLVFIDTNFPQESPNYYEYQILLSIQQFQTPIFSISKKHFLDTVRWNPYSNRRITPLHLSSQIMSLTDQIWSIHSGLYCMQLLVLRCFDPYHEACKCLGKGSCWLWIMIGTFHVSIILTNDKRQ